jgi:hypothetical protein
LTHIQNDIDPAIARCAAIAQASGIATTGEPDDFPGWDVIEDEALEFLDSCR